MSPCFWGNHENQCGPQSWRTSQFPHFCWEERGNMRQSFTEVFYRTDTQPFIRKCLSSTFANCSQYKYNIQVWENCADACQTNLTFWKKENIYPKTFCQTISLLDVLNSLSQRVFTSYLAWTTPRLSASMLRVFRTFSLSSIHDSNSWQLT